LVYSIHDSTEGKIKKMIEGNERIIAIGSGGGGGLNTTTKRLYELQIRTLQDAPRDGDKLERLLKIKQREKQEARYIEETERLATEIEMLKVVLYLVNRNREDVKS
jgi:hypothetical protein